MSSLNLCIFFVCSKWSHWQAFLYGISLCQLLLQEAKRLWNFTTTTTISFKRFALLNKFFTSSTHVTKVVQVQMGPFLTQQQQEVPSKAAFGVQLKCGVPNKVPSRQIPDFSCKGGVTKCESWESSAKKMGWLVIGDVVFLHVCCFLMPKEKCKEVDAPLEVHIESLDCIKLSSCNWTMTFLQNDCMHNSSSMMSCEFMCFSPYIVVIQMWILWLHINKCPLHCLHMEVPTMFHDVPCLDFPWFFCLDGQMVGHLIWTNGSVGEALLLHASSSQKLLAQAGSK